MGGRYYISGVQLGILKAFCKDNKALLEIVDEILENQYICEAKKFKELLNNLEERTNEKEK